MTSPGLSLPTKLDTIEAYAGDDLIIEVDFTDNNGNVVNFASYTGWKAQSRVNTKSERVMNFFVDVSKLSTGIVTISLTGSQTQQMAGYDKWGWDLQCVDSLGKTVTLITGALTFDSDWSR